MKSLTFLILYASMSDLETRRWVVPNLSYYLVPQVTPLPREESKSNP